MWYMYVSVSGLVCVCVMEVLCVLYVSELVSACVLEVWCVFVCAICVRVSICVHMLVGAGCVCLCYMCQG